MHYLSPIFIINLFIHGAIYCFLVMSAALSFSLLFGIARLLNLAHGGIFILGGYLTFLFSSIFNIPSYLALILAIVTMLAIAVSLQMVCIMPVKGMALNEALILLCIGVVMTQYINVTWGGYRAIPIYEIVKGSLLVGGVYVTFQQVTLIVSSLLFLVFLLLFLGKSKVGLALRAIALDEDVGTLMGINPAKMYLIAWSIAVVILLVFCFLSGPLIYLTTHWDVHILITSLTVVILGGLGSLRGTIAASFIMGYLETFSAALFSPLRYIITLAILITILTIRPSGLFGRQHELEERM